MFTNLYNARFVYKFHGIPKIQMFQQNFPLRITYIIRYELLNLFTCKIQPKISSSKFQSPHPRYNQIITWQYAFISTKFFIIIVSAGSSNWIITIISKYAHDEDTSKHSLNLNTIILKNMDHFFTIA